MGIAVRTLLTVLLAAACGFPRPAPLGDAGPGDDDDTPGGAVTYQLLAVEPSTATTGTVLRLEGTFADTATVHFPGGADQPATILGPHRATVTVPEGATAGDLTLSTADHTLGPLPFRRTTFALGLQPFETPFAQSNGMRQRSTLAIARSGHTATVIGDFLYVLGGTNRGMYLDSIERALINADGSLGAFSLVPELVMAAPRTGHVSAVIGPWLYLFAGSNNTGILNSVERAAISADGTLGPFKTVTGVALASARASASLEIIGNSVYIIGGTGVTGSIERATINPDSSLSTFTAVAETTLSAARSGHTSAVVGNSLYVVGGSVNDTLLGSVERAAIQPDGSLGSFEIVAGLSLGTARTGHTSAIVGGFLYTLGGRSRAGTLASVERAPIGSDGTLGAFVNVNNVALTSARGGAAAATAWNMFYLVGGASAAAELATVERASINAAPVLGKLAPAAVQLTTSRPGFLVVAIGPFIYVMGGDSPTTIERAKVHADSTLGPFELTGRTLAEPLGGLSGVVAGNYLYVFGGKLNGQRALIKPDGSLGPFEILYETTLPVVSGRSYGVIADRIYTWGGYLGNQSYQDHFSYASIASDGSIGTFQDYPTASLTLGGVGITGFVSGQFFYTLGAIKFALFDGTPFGIDIVQKASIRADGSLSALDTLPGDALGGARGAGSILAIGSAVHLLGGVGDSFPVPDIARASTSVDGSLNAFSILTPNAFTLHTVQNVAVGNAVYVFGAPPSGQTVNAIQQATLQ